MNLTDLVPYEAVRLRALRQRLNMTQQQLAEALGVSRGYVTLWEAGTRLLPKAVQTWQRWLCLRSNTTQRVHHLTTQIPTREIEGRHQLG